MHYCDANTDSHYDPTLHADQHPVFLLFDFSDSLFSFLLSIPFFMRFPVFYLFTFYFLILLSSLISLSVFCFLSVFIFIFIFIFQLEDRLGSGAYKDV